MDFLGFKIILQDIDIGKSGADQINDESRSKTVKNIIILLIFAFFYQFLILWYWYIIWGLTVYFLSKTNLVLNWHMLLRLLLNLNSSSSKLYVLCTFLLYPELLLKPIFLALPSLIFCHKKIITTFILWDSKAIKRLTLQNFLAIIKYSIDL